MPTRPADEGERYQVEEGEWVGSIAHKFGYTDWKNDVWMHGENANLRKARRDPRLLAPGDEIFIPPWDEKKLTCSAEDTHTFQLPTPTEALRIRLLDPDNKPMADEEYVLELDYDPSGGVFEQQNSKTDGNGVFEEVIPSTAIAGRLTLPAFGQTIELNLGRLFPLDPPNSQVRIRGVQQRLLALGFAPGAIDGIAGPRTRFAVMAFQKFCAENKGGDSGRITDAGEANGDITDTTCDALLKYYGC